jgi:CheY-like chemotaxis protein
VDARTLLVVEDGTEYAEFARLFLGDAFTIAHAQSAGEALELAAASPPDALLIDLRFDRTPVDALVGDLEQTASRLFSGDTGRALRYLQDQQGTLVLAELRQAGFDAPAVFVHDFPPRRLENLRRLYGRVEAVPSFDATAIRNALAQA